MTETLLSVPSRNQRCFCGSGSKYKHCHGNGTFRGQNLGEKFQRAGIVPSGIVPSGIVPSGLQNLLGGNPTIVGRSNEAKEVLHVGNTFQGMDIPSEKERNEIYNHQRDVQSWYTRYLADIGYCRVCKHVGYEKRCPGKEKGFPCGALMIKGVSLSVSTEPAQKHILRPGDAVGQRMVGAWRNRAFQSGFLYESNVKDFCHVLMVMQVTGKSITGLGDMQSGKTTTLISFQQLGPAIYTLTRGMQKRGEAITPLAYWPIISTPNSCSLEDESVYANNNFLALYGMMIWSDSKTSGVNTDLDHNTSTLLGYDEYVLARNRGDACVTLDLKNKIMRRSVQEMDKLHTLLQERVLDNLDAGGTPRNCSFRSEFLLFLDEGDQGATDDEKKQIKSLQARLMDKHLRYPGSDGTRSLHEICHDPTKYSRVILVSASPWTSITQSITQDLNCELVNLTLGEGYCGFNKFNCEMIDSSQKKVTPPIIGDFDNIPGAGKVMGRNGYKVNAFTLLDPNAYGNPSKLLDLQNREKDSHISRMKPNEYDKWFIETLAKTINTLAKSGTVVIRLRNNNSDTDSIVEALKKLRLDSHIASGSWMGKEKGTAIEFIHKLQKEGNGNKTAVVFVTGRGRRGDPFGNVRNFIEFAKESMALASMQQGLLGRACGYNKIIDGIPPTVWFNIVEANEIRTFYANNANPACSRKKPHSTCDLVGPSPRHLGTTVGVGWGLHDKVDVYMERFNAMLPRILKNELRDNNAVLRYSTAEIRASGIDVKTRKKETYFPVFDGNIADYLQESQIAKQLMPTDRITLCPSTDYRFHTEFPSYCDVSFDWAKEVTDFHYNVHSLGKYQSERREKGGYRRKSNFDKDGSKNYKVVVFRVVRVIRGTNHIVTGAMGFRPENEWRLFKVVLLCEEPTITKNPMMVKPTRAWTGREPWLNRRG
jgi:hypothetical protein